MVLPQVVFAPERLQSLKLLPDDADVLSSNITSART